MNRIKEFRTEYGLSQQDVCNIAGMPKRTLENWEEGSRKPATWVEDLVLYKLYREHFDWIAKNKK